MDSVGNTLDFLLTVRRDGNAAKRFLRKVLQREHVQVPRVINADKFGSYVRAIRELKQSGELPESCQHRRVKSLNNMVEQEHRFVRWRVKASQHFKSFWSAERTLRGYETINLIRKGQLDGVARGDVFAQTNFLNQLFGIAVWKIQGLQQALVTNHFVATKPFLQSAMENTLAIFPGRSRVLAVLALQTFQRVAINLTFSLSGS